MQAGVKTRACALVLAVVVWTYDMLVLLRLWG